MVDGVCWMVGACVGWRVVDGGWRMTRGAWCMVPQLTEVVAADPPGQRFANERKSEPSGLSAFLSGVGLPQCLDPVGEAVRVTDRWISPEAL